MGQYRFFTLLLIYWTMKVCISGRRGSRKTGKKLWGRTNGVALNKFTTARIIHGTNCTKLRCFYAFRLKAIWISLVLNFQSFESWKNEWSIPLPITRWRKKFPILLFHIIYPSIIHSCPLPFQLNLHDVDQGCYG